MSPSSLVAQDLSQRGVLRSRSGQFVVAQTQVTVAKETTSAAGTEDEEQLVNLEPGTLVLTCERVRQALLRELQQPDAWLGRFSLVGGEMSRLRPGEEPLSFSAGETEVILYVLVVGGGEIDSLAAEAMEASRMYPGGWGADLVRRLRRALEGRDEDFALQAAWIDERS